MEKRATREGYGEGLGKICKDPRVVVLDADLSGSTKSKIVKEICPRKFINVGIAEQDLVGMAAGLALSGKIPFASTFAVFATDRAHDQIRVSVAYSNANVRIVGSHAGILTGEDGPTHQAIDDIAAIRSIPNMSIIHPADFTETVKATEYLLEHKGPVYLRLGRAKLPIINSNDYKFEFGRGVELKKGNDVTIIATGPLVHEALSAHEELKRENINARVINIHTIKPLDKEIILKAAKETGAIVTAEDHNILGGLGSAVSEVVVNDCPVPIEFIGVKDCFAESGKPFELYEKFGLGYSNLVKAAKKAISRK